MNPAELLRGEPSLLAIYEQTVGALMRLPADALTDELRGLIARALRDAAEVGASDPAPQEIRHTHQPSTGKIGVKVTRSTQGVSVEVDVDRPKAEDETWGYAASDATAIASDAYGHAVGRLLHDHGLTVGKDAKVGA